MICSTRFFSQPFSRDDLYFSVPPPILLDLPLGLHFVRELEDYEHLLVIRLMSSCFILDKNILTLN